MYVYGIFRLKTIALSDCDPGTWNLIGWEGNICVDLFGTGEVELLEG